MSNNPKKPKPIRNSVFTVSCPFGNTIFLTEKTWLQHSIPRHVEQDLVGNVEHVKATVEDPDRARRSTDAHHGQDSCIYEKVIGGTNSIIRVPVLFDSKDYEKGGLIGRVMTVLMLGPGQWDSGQVGKIFWIADRGKSKT
jgi:hypothetical protein